jgi:hypothetical protein
MRLAQLHLVMSPLPLCGLGQTNILIG